MYFRQALKKPLKRFIINNKNLLKWTTDPIRVTVKTTNKN